MQIEPVNAPKVSGEFFLKLRNRFYNKLVELHGKSENFERSVCFFRGVPTMPKHYDDTDYAVEQQSTFWYLFGVKEPDCYAIIENDKGTATLFIPRRPEMYKMWMYVKPEQLFKSDYLVERVLFVDEIQDYLKDYKPSVTFLFSGTDSDSGIQSQQPQENYLKHCENINRNVLWNLIGDLRVVKTEEEIQMMRYVCKLATDAHIKVMKSVKPGLTQMQMSTLFHFQHAIKCGCNHQAFSSICSSGRDCATLHYIQNDKIIESGQMLLHDMGGKWNGYCADQAITFPVDGKFTEKQKKIYNAVYQAQKAVLQTLKPGVNWGDMHLLAERVILEHLMQIGIVNKSPMEQLVQKRIGAIFFPHGLGHLLGLRVHDIGGYTSGPIRSDKAGLKSLRTRRDMEQGTIMTVEPGCYFIDFIIKNALQDPERSKYLNAEKIDEYKDVGGVRLEDNVVVRKDGPEMLSFLPRKWEDVEKVMAEK